MTSHQMERIDPEHRSPLETNPSKLSIMIVAGEASGDKHGASLARALRKTNPEIKYELFGSGGEEMRAAGVETLVDARDVGIIGVPEIARAIPRLLRAYRTLLNAARARRPSAVVLIDWPDFNMRLAKKLHGEGFKIIYYISPQVWAWRRYRTRALRRDVDRMLVILPFEEEFYKRAGLEVRYVGHPLAGAVHTTASREDFCRRHKLDPKRPIFALLPGSRQKEIHYHLPVMLDAAVRLRVADYPKRIDRESADSQKPNRQSTIGNPQFVVPLASTVRRRDVSAAIREARLAAGASGEPEELSVTVIEEDTYNALGHSEFAVVASGTATVETALAGTPMVIIYRGSEVNWRLIRPLIHLDTFGMVNLIAGRRIVPELMQRDATGEKIAREATELLSDPERLARTRRDLERIRELLATQAGSAADRAARSVIEVIRES
jgi:lipid-A-disaccharide synthase